MAVELTTTLRLTLTGTLESINDLSTTRDEVSASGNDTLATGNIVDTADAIWSDTRSLAATTEDLDLRGGLTDAFGRTLQLATIKALYIRNNNTTAGHNLTVGDGTNGVALYGAAAGTKVIGPGGIELIWEPSLAGVTVTAGTADIIKLDAGANTISYDIVIVGTIATTTTTTTSTTTAGA